MKGNNREDMKIKKDARLQCRISSEHKQKLIELANKRGYKNLSEYILYLALKDISESEFVNKQILKNKHQQLLLEDFF